MERLQDVGATAAGAGPVLQVTQRLQKGESIAAWGETWTKGAPRWIVLQAMSQRQRVCVQPSVAGGSVRRPSIQRR